MPKIQLRHFEWFSNSVSRAYLLLFLLKKEVVRRWCWSCRSKTQRLMLENFSSLLLFHYFSFIEFQSQLLKRDDDDANKGEKFSLVCCSSGSSSSKFESLLCCVWQKLSKATTAATTSTSDDDDDDDDAFNRSGSSTPSRGKSDREEEQTSFWCIMEMGNNLWKLYRQQGWNSKYLVIILAR